MVSAEERLETASLTRPPNLVLPALLCSACGDGVSGALGTSGLLSAEHALVDRNIHPHSTETVIHWPTPDTPHGTGPFALQLIHSTNDYSCLLCPRHCSES